MGRKRTLSERLERVEGAPEKRLEELASTTRGGKPEHAGD
jgi:hypothetical protein